MSWPLQWFFCPIKLPMWTSGVKRNDLISFLGYFERSYIDREMWEMTLFLISSVVTKYRNIVTKLLNIFLSHFDLVTTLSSVSHLFSCFLISDSDNYEWFSKLKKKKNTVCEINDTSIKLWKLRLCCLEARKWFHRKMKNHKNVCSAIGWTTVPGLKSRKKLGFQAWKLELKSL